MPRRRLYQATRSPMVNVLVMPRTAHPLLGSAGRPRRDFPGSRPLPATPLCHGGGIVRFSLAPLLRAVGVASWSGPVSGGGGGWRTVVPSDRELRPVVLA